jgi:hypothetical protein
LSHLRSGITQDLYDRTINASELLYELQLGQKDSTGTYTYAQIAMGCVFAFDSLVFDLHGYFCVRNALYLLGSFFSHVRSFMKDVYTRIRSVRQNVSTEKIAFFSGHDTTLLPILAALGNAYNIWPPYASLLRIELLNGM